MGREVAKVEEFLDSNRKRFHVEQVYSRFSEQGWAQTRVDIDIKDPEQTKQIEEALRSGMPKSARANIGIGRQGGMGGNEKGIQFSLTGDSTDTLKELADDIMPILARSKNLRDVRVDTGDTNSELSVRVNRERAASFGFSAQQVAQFVGLALRGVVTARIPPG